jgi:hypothetical protein
MLAVMLFETSSLLVAIYAFIGLGVFALLLSLFIRGARQDYDNLIKKVQTHEVRHIYLDADGNPTDPPKNRQ